jgi:hypothetical protein
MVVDRLGSTDEAVKNSEPKEPFALPFESRPLLTTDWLFRWPSVTPYLADKYGWYIAEIPNKGEALIMPIYRFGKPVFYSGRLLGTNVTKHKYHYPSGVQRQYWLSDHPLFKSTVFFAEGVADAVVLSQYGTSVALLGMNYDGSLDGLLKGCRVILAMDGDVAGVCGAVQIAKKLPVPSTIYSIPGKDPSEWTREEAEGACR